MEDAYNKFKFIDDYRPEPPGPDPPPPDPPDPPTPPGPGPEPPAPGYFTPWYTNPGTSILQSGYWINRTFTGGYSKIPNRSQWGSYPGQQYSMPNGSTLPNCTGWAFGRLMYIVNTHDATSIPVYGDAQNWYTSTYWPTSQIPSQGAVMCWYGGGAGHVAIVEGFTGSGANWQTCIVSESAFRNGYYGGTWWNYGGIQTTTVSRSAVNRWGYTFQGFINTPANLIVR